MNTMQKEHLRKPIVAGNWKMNLVLSEAVDLTKHLHDTIIREQPGVQVVLYPAYPFLGQVADRLRTNPDLGMGAQNVSPYESGAHTGEVSVAMLRSVGVSHVLIGHSERRAMYGASNALTGAQISAVHRAGLRPMLCVGETLEEREAGNAESIVADQLSAALSGENEYNWNYLVIAYEPVWAIGTGRVAGLEEIESMHLFIRSWISENFDKTASSRIRILYGGSLNPENSREIFRLPNVDGGLVGGASLTFNSFIEIVRAAAPGGHSK